MTCASVSCQAHPLHAALRSASLLHVVQKLSQAAKHSQELHVRIFNTHAMSRATLKPERLYQYDQHCLGFCSPHPYTSAQFAKSRYHARVMSEVHLTYVHIHGRPLIQHAAF